VANFNLADYETVDSRIKRFYVDHPNGSITTDLVDWSGEIGQTRWVVKASVWRDRVLVDGEPGLMAVCPDGTGYAFEVDGAGMAQKTAALETAETSAIGRALANIGYSGDKRASREEMSKAAPQEDSAALDMLASEWVDALNDADTLPALQSAWEAAGRAGVTADRRVIAAKDARKKALQ
jgi:hypothetical protein